MFKKITFLAVAIVQFLSVSAHEGMWLPILLKSLNESDMQSMGLKLSAEDIYSVNKSSLKDAVVHFGGFCTGEVVSDNGLVFTNHHCGYGQIQQHSTLENNYLKDGFWAKNNQEELPNEGLYVSFLKYMEDVTPQIMEAVNGVTDEVEKQQIIQATIDAIVGEKMSGTGYDAYIRPFDYGNAYYLFVLESFHDVRLVGAPSSSIGKYGFDTDNWVWPRHTGDFSVFRIYADKNNKPAYYSKDNVPYTPAHSLPISMKPVKQDDFTMVFGFPGRTEHNLTSYDVDYLLNTANPLKIDFRQNALDIIDAGMRSDELIAIQYAAKQSRIANTWKKWKGQVLGLTKYNAVQVKQEEEIAFMEKLKANKELYAEYGMILDVFAKSYEENASYKLAADMMNEYYYVGPEFFKFIRNINRTIKDFENSEDKELSEEQIASLTVTINNYFDDYNFEIDKELFEVLTENYLASIDEDLQPEFILELLASSKGDYSVLADKLYDKSLFSNRDRLLASINKLNKKSLVKFKEDALYSYRENLLNYYELELQDKVGTFEVVKQALLEKYVYLKKELYPNNVTWYDANSTMRLSYGTVDRTKARDGIIYDYYTTLEGVFDKYIEDDYEFDLPEKLLELYANKDYGQYATEDGELRVCFLAANHTTGGNSGSPVINGEGQLVGINFDRSWESTMSDIMYSPEICRNIAVDVHYVLFVIDKVGGATWLIDEMNLVK